MNYIWFLIVRSIIIVKIISFFLDFHNLITEEKHNLLTRDQGGENIRRWTQQPTTEAVVNPIILAVVLLGVALRDIYCLQSIFEQYLRLVSCSTHNTYVWYPWYIHTVYVRYPWYEIVLINHLRLFISE